MKKILLVSLVSVFIMVMLSCGGPSAKDLTVKMIDIQKEFISAVEGASDGKVVIAAFEEAKKQFARLKPEMKKVQEDLKKDPAKIMELAADMKDIMKDMTDVTMKMNGCLRDLTTKFKDNGEVMNGLQSFQKALANINK